MYALLTSVQQTSPSVPRSTQYSRSDLTTSTYHPRNLKTVVTQEAPYSTEMIRYPRTNVSTYLTTLKR